MREPVKIALGGRCPDCGGVVQLTRGLREAFDKNPRSVWPGMFLLGVFLAVMGCAWVLRLLIYEVFGTTPDPNSVSMAIAVLLIPALLMRCTPLRMLVCSSCRRTLKTGLGVAVPLDWQEYLVPDWRCKRCDYSLIGVVENARCPECEHPFPAEWLKATRLAVENPDIAVE